MCNNQTTYTLEVITHSWPTRSVTELDNFESRQAAEREGQKILDSFDNLSDKVRSECFIYEIRHCSNPFCEGK